MASNTVEKKSWFSRRGCLLILAPVLLTCLALASVPPVMMVRYYTARDQLESTGGNLNGGRGDRPLKVRDGSEWLAPFRSVTFAKVGSEATEVDFRTVARFKAIREIHIECTPTPADMRHLATLPELAKISINTHDKPLPPGALKELRNFSSLRQLRFYGWRIDDSSLSAIDTLHQVTHLMLVDLDVSDNSLEKISRLPNLRGIHIVNCKGVTDKGFESLSSLQNIQMLSVISVPVGDTILRTLETSEVSDLTLIDTSCTNKGFEQIAKLQKLEVLRFDEKINDEALLHIAKLSNLRRVQIDSCETVTREGLIKLRSQLPDAEFDCFCLMFMESESE